MPDVIKTLGRYELLREVGRGGMATVYEARDTALDRFVALKEMATSLSTDRAFTQRFLREARVASSLSHPNIVAIHDFFEYGGAPYIAMEYVACGSLRSHVGHMTLAQIAGVLEGLLAGLTNAEQRGIVHRDLKPENLMVTSDGSVKIADFGIAKATKTLVSDSFVTDTGVTVGTPVYMAPEQAMAEEVGAWTDLYSVGCMAFEMFTGNVPFHDTDAPMALLLRHINETIPSVKSIDSSIDEGISDWIDGLVARDPAARTQRASDAWDDFEEIVINLLGPRWRRAARLTVSTEDVEGPKPLTPAPFQGAGSGAPEASSLISEWGATDTGGGTAPPEVPSEEPAPVDAESSGYVTVDPERFEPGRPPVESEEATPAAPPPPEPPPPTRPPRTRVAAPSPGGDAPSRAHRRRLVWVGLLVAAAVVAGAATYLTRPGADPDPGPGGREPAPNAFRTSAFTTTSPAGWRVVCRDVSGECAGASLRRRVRRSAFVTRNRDAGITIDRTSLQAEGNVSVGSLVDTADATLRDTLSGYSSTAESPRRLRFRGRQVLTFEFTSDEPNLADGVVYAFKTSDDAYVVTGAGEDVNAVRRATRSLAAELRPRG